MVHSLVKFLQDLSEIDEPRLFQLSKAAKARGDLLPIDRFSRISFSSPEVLRALRNYYGRTEVSIKLVLPQQRGTSELLKFAKLEAYTDKGSEVGTVLPLAVLTEEMVDALHADLREQLAPFQ